MRDDGGSGFDEDVIELIIEDGPEESLDIK